MVMPSIFCQLSKTPLLKLMVGNMAEAWLPPVVSSADDDWLAEVYRLDDWRKAADALGIVQPKEGGVGIEG